jgi:hypothetical protein
MPKFFQSEIAAYDGEKSGFQNVKFKKNDFRSSTAAEAGAVLEFIPVHYPNPPVIQFIAYITNLSENFDVQYAAEQPFGRTNPYYVWQNNNRTISLGFDLPASGISKGLDNLNNLSWLVSSLYPSYKESNTATSVAATPLFRVRYANLICSSTKNGQGLLCAIGNVSVNHDTEKGFLSANPKNMGTSFANTAGKVLSEAGFENHVSEGSKILIPKLMKLTLDLKVVHDHALGWDYHTGDFRGGRSAPTFPHDFGLVREASDPPSNPGMSSGPGSSGPPAGPAHNSTTNEYREIDSGAGERTDEGP